MYQQDYGVIGTGVQGLLLDNGDFIFSVVNSGLRKMALLTNQGLHIKGSYVEPSVATWKDVSTWPAGDYYTVQNFKGVEKGRCSMFREIITIFVYNTTGLRKVRINFHE